MGGTEGACGRSTGPGRVQMVAGWTAFSKEGPCGLFLPQNDLGPYHSQK